jgi:hypothetical protein
MRRERRRGRPAPVHRDRRRSRPGLGPPPPPRRRAPRAPRGSRGRRRKRPGSIEASEQDHRRAGDAVSASSSPTRTARAALPVEFMSPSQSDVPSSRSKTYAAPRTAGKVRGVPGAPARMKPSSMATEVPSSKERMAGTVETSRCLRSNSGPRRARRGAWGPTPERAPASGASLQAHAGTGRPVRVPRHRNPPPPPIPRTAPGSLP